MPKNNKPSNFDRILLMMNLLSIILISTFTFFPQIETIRILLGMPFLLLFPGYSVISALYPGEGLGGVERLVYGLGLSLAIIPPLGFLLNYSPYGLNLTTITFSLFTLMLLSTMISWLRRRKISPEKRFHDSLSIQNLYKWVRNERKLAIGCIITLFLVTAGGLYLTTHQYGDEFTEFYLENKVNPENGGNSVTLGIVNHRGEAEKYSIRVVMDNQELEKVENIRLESGASWENSISFWIKQNLENRTLRFVLYRDFEKTEKELTIHGGVD